MEPGAYFAPTWKDKGAFLKLPNRPLLQDISIINVI